MAAASTNTIPKPSCSSPPHRVRHGMANTSAAPCRSGRSSWSMRPKNVTGATRCSAAGRRRRRWSRPRPAMTSWRSRYREASCPTASMTTSKPCRGTSREIDATSSASAGNPNRARRRGARPRRAGRSARRRPRADDRDRRLLAGGVLGLAGGVLHRRHDVPGRPGARWPADWRDPGVRPGTDTSAPCSTTSYGRSRPGPTSPSGTAGSSTTSSAPHRSAIRSIWRVMPGCGGSTRSRVRSIRNGSAASKSAAPGYGLVKHGELVVREPAPPLPQRRLDPADLRREVVRDEQVLRRAARRRPSQALAHAACSADGVVAVAVDGQRRDDARVGRIGGSSPAPRGVAAQPTTDAPAIYHRP